MFSSNGFLGKEKMWIIGHTACAYLLIKLVYNLKKQKIGPNSVIFIFIFANLIDSLHFGILRIMTHNLIGTLLYSILWLFIFKKLKLIIKNDYPALLIAVSTHIITDILFSSYYLFFPFKSTSYSIFGWNSPEHLIVGSFIVILFIIVFILSGDFLKLKLFVREKRKNFFSEFYLKKIVKKQHFPFYLFIVFYLFLIAQFLIFLYLFINVLLEGIWYFWMFLIVFGLFSFIMSYLLLGSNSDKKIRTEFIP